MTAVFVTGIFAVSSAVSAQTYDSFDSGALNSANLANRKTALRCLELAKNYSAKKQWTLAVSQAELGLSYDNKIADLWYILAVSKTGMGESKNNVLQLVTKSLYSGEWLDYNRDSARVLYADILSDTLRGEQAIEVLDSKPVIFSADAEYIRAKSYYRIGQKENARLKIDTARKMYPDDIRFPLLFFTYEDSKDTDEFVVKTASNFNQRIRLYGNGAPELDAELQIKAAGFAFGEEQERMLKSFNARRYRHPLYAILAYQNNLLTPQKALSYMASFADSRVDFDLFNQFFNILAESKDSEVMEKSKEYLAQYSGILCFDTDGDKINNMEVKFTRGRPATIVYDQNQDENNEFIVACDFGVPVHADVNYNHFSVEWENYPYLSTAVFHGSDNSELVKFNIIQNELAWSPVSIEYNQFIYDEFGVEFYIPSYAKNQVPLTTKLLVDKCYNYQLKSRERKNALITYIVLDGHTQLAEYTMNGKLYAQAEFQNGVPAIRIVDADDDGVFETTEFYGFTKDVDLMIQTSEEEKAIMTNLFGLPSTGEGFYLSKIQIDRNKNTIPDFIEEYMAFGEKFTSWDTNEDGLWDVQYHRLPRVKDSQGRLDPLVEESSFYDIKKDLMITVRAVDGVPSKVISGDQNLEVIKDKENDFYWIGQAGGEFDAQICVNELNALGNQGECIVVTTKENKILCVRVGNYLYGKIVHALELEQSEK